MYISEVVCNHLGLVYNFSCQEHLAFQKAKKAFFVARFSRQPIDYIYSLYQVGANTRLAELRYGNLSLLTFSPMVVSDITITKFFNSFSSSITLANYYTFLS